MDIESDRYISACPPEPRQVFKKASASFIKHTESSKNALRVLTKFYAVLHKYTETVQITPNRANWASEIVMERVQQLHSSHSLPLRGQVSELCIKDKFYGSIISNSEQGQHARQVLE